MDKLDEFKNFVKNRDDIIKLVSNKEKSWQELYEQYFMLGEDSFDNKIDKVNNNENDTTISKTSDDDSNNTISSILNYIKKINPSTLTKGLSTAQKVVSMFSNSKTTKTPTSNDTLFNKINW